MNIILFKEMKMGINVFLQVMFWLYIISIFLRCLIIIVSEYPRVAKVNIGVDLINLIIGIAFFVWVCVLRNSL